MLQPWAYMCDRCEKTSTGSAPLAVRIACSMACMVAVTLLQLMDVSSVSTE